MQLLLPYLLCYLGYQIMCYYLNKINMQKNSTKLFKMYLQKLMLTAEKLMSHTTNFFVFNLWADQVPEVI